MNQRQLSTWKRKARVYQGWAATNYAEIERLRELLATGPAPKIAEFARSQLLAHQRYQRANARNARGYLHAVLRGWTNEL